MVRKIEIDNLHCLCTSKGGGKDKIAYILYPMDMLADWIEAASEKYDTAIVVIIGMDWQNVFSPWPAKGVPDGSPNFKGEAPRFLKTLQTCVIPQIESELNIDGNPKRTLFGVSMSGLFALWQWIICDSFDNIASLSGSFWYEGFLDWLKSQPIPVKRGKAYFLLGNQEANSRVREFNSVAANTRSILLLLDQHGINVEFQSVRGNHYSDPIPRLDKAFTALYRDIRPE